MRTYCTFFTLFTETSDDILAKYRKPAAKPSSSQEGVAGGGGGEPVMSSSVCKMKDDDKVEGPFYDPANLESCHAFLDTKKKLRRVLSHADPTLFNWPGRGITRQFAEHKEPAAGPIKGGAHRESGIGGSDLRDGELLALLQLQLAEAINLKDRDFVTQLHETIRCLRQFDAHEWVEWLAL